MRNAGFLFYKEYFKQLRFDNGKPSLNFQNDSLYNLKLDYKFEELFSTEDSFELTTIYPGLLIGSGYNHEIGGKELEGELKLGFFFDYTTGIPCIPGSSVKGVLRVACGKDNGGYAVSITEQLRSNDELNEEIKKSLKEIDSQKMFSTVGNQPSHFINHVFNGKKDNDIYLPYKERDIFFDSFPIKSNKHNGKFLANDYITPHKHPKNPKLDPFTNPNPIQFLKVLPKVTFKFSFRLTDTCINKKIKLELFKQILLDLGVGAKTNVGYGQFI
ncbi:MAG TPA: type III-B CRISPR module RAMP protein Cmr6 [Ignavibacteria bacterium]|nr:type III-B CRISPR module RAMP protein Cmr6 [Ignavibacteria bacterium]